MLKPYPEGLHENPKKQSGALNLKYKTVTQGQFTFGLAFILGVAQHCRLANKKQIYGVLL